MLLIFPLWRQGGEEEREPPPCKDSFHSSHWTVQPCLVLCKVEGGGGLSTILDVLSILSPFCQLLWQPQWLVVPCLTTAFSPCLRCLLCGNAFPTPFIDQYSSNPSLLPGTQVRWHFPASLAVSWNYMTGVWPTAREWKWCMPFPGLTHTQELFAFCRLMQRSTTPGELSDKGGGAKRRKQSTCFHLHLEENHLRIIRNTYFGKWEINFYYVMCCFSSQCYRN